MGFPLYIGLRHDISKDSLIKILKSHKTKTLSSKELEKIENSNNGFNIANLDKIDGKVVVFEENNDYNLLDITDLFSEAERIKCSGKSVFMSPYEFFKTYHTEIYTKARKELGYRKDNKYLLNKKARYLIYSSNYSCSLFKISQALNVLNYFKPKTWLDFSSGWGDRLLASIVYGVDKYVGVDPNKKLLGPYNKIIQTIEKDKSRYNNYTIVFDEFQKANIPDIKYDLVFTSPPFFVLEFYESMKNQDYIFDINDWIYHFLYYSIIKCCYYMKKGSKLVLYIEDIDYSKMWLDIRYVDDMVKFIETTLPFLKYHGSLYYRTKSTRQFMCWNMKKDFTKEELTNAMLKEATNPDITKLIETVSCGIKQYKIPRNHFTLLNPLFKITQHEIFGKNVSFIRDDMIPGGTYFRYFIEFLPRLKQEHICITDVNEFRFILGIIATCILSNKTLHIFYRQRHDKKIKEMNSIKYKKIYYHSIDVDETEEKRYEIFHQKCDNKISSLKKKYGLRNILKLNIVSLLAILKKSASRSIRNSMTLEMHKYPPSRLWFVNDLYLVYKVLRIVYPKEHFMIVHHHHIRDLYDTDFEKNTNFMFGKKIDVEYYYKFEEFPVEPHTDLKMFKFFEQHIKQGDLIWNFCGTVKHQVNLINHTLLRNK